MTDLVYPDPMTTEEFNALYPDDPLIPRDEFIKSDRWTLISFSRNGKQHIAQVDAGRVLCGFKIEPNGRRHDLFSEAYLCTRCRPKYMEARVT